jgi:uncharacterized integral membrane protein
VSEGEDLEPDDEVRSPASSLDDSSQSDRPRGSRHGGEHFRHTRISAAWVSVVVAIVFGVALIDFIAQNTRDIRIDFFSASGHIPVAVALLVAALSGAIVVVAVGVGRVAQLRLTMRRQRRRHDAEHDTKS